MSIGTSTPQETAQENIDPSLIHGARKAIDLIGPKEKVNMEVEEAIENMEEDPYKWSTVITNILVENYSLLTEENKKRIREHQRTAGLINVIETKSAIPSQKKRKRKKKKKATRRSVQN